MLDCGKGKEGEREKVVNTEHSTLCVACARAVMMWLTRGWVGVGWALIMSEVDLALRICSG